MEIFILYKVVRLLLLVGALITHSTFGGILDKRLLSSSNTIVRVVEITSEDDSSGAKTNSIPTFPQFVSLPTENITAGNEGKTLTGAYQCNLSQTLIDEIRGYQTVANKIFKTLLTGSFKGRTYSELAYFVDRFGSRLAGSQNLENAIDYMLDKMTQDGLENVHGEEVNIPHWVRYCHKYKFARYREIHTTYTHLCAM